MVNAWLWDVLHYPGSELPHEYSPALMADAYERRLDEWQAAERLGFHGVFVAEHHGTVYSVMPSPNVILAALAARTTTLRIGSMANVMPFHDPFRLAEEGAMLDVISRGRLEMGIGRGANQDEFRLLGKDMTESRQRMVDGIELIRKAWTSNTFSHDGPFYQSPTATLYPRPVQDPPPIWITATATPITMSWAAAHGFKVVTGFGSIPATKAMFDTYLAAARAAGHIVGSGHLGVSCHTYVAATESQALDEGEAAFERFVELFSRGALFDDMNDLPKGYEAYKSFLKPFYADHPPTFRQLVHHGVLQIGSPEQVTERVVELCRGTGAGHYLANMNFGNMPENQVRRSELLFANHVIPALATVDHQLATAT
jgi:alkanesulfonate monooxygenase SsuD/methylene tetrahydromethanopterin reductase-like flavin-dependent oxidoreductase (luciferase family)